jgi:hypothetical protein
LINLCTGVGLGISSQGVILRDLLLLDFDLFDMDEYAFHYTMSMTRLQVGTFAFLFHLKSRLAYGA